MNANDANKSQIMRFIRVIRMPFAYWHRYFSTNSSPSPITKLPPNAPIRLAFLGRFALVVLLLSSYDRYGDFDEVALTIN